MLDIDLQIYDCNNNIHCFMLKRIKGPNSRLIILSLLADPMG